VEERRFKRRVAVDLTRWALALVAPLGLKAAPGGAQNAALKGRSSTMRETCCHSGSRLPVKG
jgi:hypothetical protein